MKAPGLPPASEVVSLALASAYQADRPMFAAAFALDATLGRIVSLSGEPALKQIRLAWWRDQLRGPAIASAVDPVLLAVRENFQGKTPKLVAVVDGWEHLLAGPVLTSANLADYADGRGDLFGVLAERLGLDSAAAKEEGRAWALADYAAHCSLSDDARLATTVPLAPSRFRHLERRLRPLAVLGGLARRSLARGGGSLLGDRMSPFVAARIAVLGR